MHTASLHRVDTSYPSDGSTAPDPSKRAVAAAQEVRRLSDENGHLRQVCEDLTIAAESWIHLYERALARANAADARLAALETTAGVVASGNRNA